MKKEQNETKVTVGGIDVTDSGRDVIWPIFLIFLGVMLLLNSMSIINWSIWIYLIRFWPVLLILGGLRIVIGRSKVGEIVMGIVAILLFSAIGFYAYIINSTEKSIWFIPENTVEKVRESYTGVFQDLGERESSEFIVAQGEYENVEEINLNIQTAATTFSITDEESENILFLDTNYYEGYGTPQLTKEVSKEELNLFFKSTFIEKIFGWRNDSPSYDFVLGDIKRPYTLDIDFGAGRGEIVLDEVKLDSLSADIGAGELDIELGEVSIASGSLSFDIGAGDVTVTIPEDIGFTLSYTIGVGDVDINNTDVATFIGDGTYKSDNYNDAEVTLDIDINVGAGAFNIVTK